MDTNELPPTWSWSTLKDIGDLYSGGTPKTSEPENFDGEIAWITPADLTGYTDKTIARGRRNISEIGLKTSSATMMPSRTVVFSSRAPIGYVAIARNEMATNQGFKSVAVHDGIFDEFVYYYLKSAKQLAEANASGTTFKEISGARFGKLPIPLPPLPEQRRIVEKIETLFARLDKGEEAVREVQKLLTRYRQSVLKSAVTGELIKSDRSDWEAVELGDLLKDIRYGTAKKCGYEAANTAVLRIPNVVSGEVDLGDLKYTDLNEKDRAKLSLEKGDILIVRSNGSANLVARGAVVGEDAVGMAFAGYLIRLRIDQGRILPSFLQMSLNAPQTRMPIERNARSTSGVHNINSGEVKAVPVELPPIEEQLKIMTAVDDAFQKIVDLERWCETELKRSASLRQSILKDAFAGRLVPQDPTDEPASALLARIVEAKASPKKTRGKVQS